MNRPVVALLVLMVAGGVLTGTACAKDYGAEANAVDAGDAVDSGVVPVADANPGAEGGTVGVVGVAPCDPNEAPPPTAVYVSGSAGGGNGTAAAPYGSIGASLNRAKLDGSSVIIIAAGSYAEDVALESFTTSLKLDGAWVRSASAWTRDCSPDRRTKTALRSSSDVGLRIRNNTGAITIANMTIQPSAPVATPADSAGASRYGVFVEGSVVVLENVNVVATAAAPGGKATDGAPGGVSACTELTKCNTAPTPGPDAPSPAPATAGSFAATGFIPAAGSLGAGGGVGSYGTPGGPGASGDCSGGCSPTCDPQPKIAKTGDTGRCGCGGPGGGPGAAGQGGGASVALFAAGASRVDVKWSELVANAGGHGTPGGLGGSGGVPSVGVIGASTACWEPMCCEIGTCPGACACYFHDNWPAASCPAPAPVNNVIPGGNAGGAGAPGGRGATGSGGAGGPSYAYASVAGAVVTVMDSKRAFGTGGTGAAGAPGGASGEKP